MYEPSEWAFAIARELQGQWDRNDEDVCSLTVAANVARALDTAKAEARREGAEAVIEYLRHHGSCRECGGGERLANAAELAVLETDPT